MVAVAGIFTLLFAVLISLLVVRVATVALTLTGLARELARFEARSAFTGAGFTTADSEKVVSHPVRRQIIMMLMLMGNAGIVTIVSSLILSFMNSGGAHWSASIPFRMVLLVFGLASLWLFAHSKWVDAKLSDTIAWSLRRFTTLDVHDYVGLLRLAKNYEVAEMKAEAGNWLTNKTLMELRLGDEGVLILGIERADGAYIGAPKGPSRLLLGDKLLVYGASHGLSELDTRPAGPEGEAAHDAAVDRQKIEDAEHINE